MVPFYVSIMNFTYIFKLLPKTRFLALHSMCPIAPCSTRVNLTDGSPTSLLAWKKKSNGKLDLFDDPENDETLQLKH